MTLEVIPLRELLKSDATEEEINRLLFSFECKSLVSGAIDVEEFLHFKAIQFEKMDLARTYLVLSSYQSTPYLAGYFSIMNKSLIIPKRQYRSFSGALKKKLIGMGHKTEQDNYEIRGYLLGQLGKNYSEISTKANNASGADLLALAYEKILDAYIITGGRILFLECEDQERLRNFYNKNGFKMLENYESVNKYLLFVKWLKDI